MNTQPPVPEASAPLPDLSAQRIDEMEDALFADIARERAGPIRGRHGRRVRRRPRRLRRRLRWRLGLGHHPDERIRAADRRTRCR